MDPVLKAPVIVMLKLRYDGPLSNFAFKFNVRRYSMVRRANSSPAAASHYFTPTFTSTAGAGGRVAYPFCFNAKLEPLLCPSVTTQMSHAMGQRCSI